MILATLLWVVAAVLLIAAGATLAFLFTPIRVSAAVDTAAKPPWRVKLALFGGRLPIVSAPGKPSERRAKPPQPRAKPKQKKKRRRAAAAHAPRIIRAAPPLLSRLLAQVKLETLDAHIRFGFDDPADTGMVYGALSPLALLAGRHVTLQPDFDGTVLTGRGQIAARLTPAALIPPLAAFAWTVFVAPQRPPSAR